MVSTRRLLAVAFLGLTLVSCTKKDECEVCSSDDSCKPGFVCSTFDDGSRRCGQGTGATSCPTR
jgi:hypothetical protein